LNILLDDESYVSLDETNPELINKLKLLAREYIQDKREILERSLI